ncbi:MAG: hypothetical protein OEY07_21180, partial [Gammaproteobacteria bacterium]|nr:hypothetical protein [Gammaproteobacteria bacterium]
MKSRKVLAVTTNFPSPRFPEKGVFVRNILLEMTRQNADVDVIAPLSWVAGLKTLFKPKQKVNLSPLNVQQPMITTFSLRFGKFIYKFFMWLNDLSFNRGVRRSINHDTKYDFCYCHFLRSGLAVVDLLKSKNTPIVLNVGESNLSVYDNYYGSEWIEKLSDFDHILAVSKEN